MSLPGSLSPPCSVPRCIPQLHPQLLMTGTPYSSLPPNHCPSSPSWMSLVRAGICADGVSLHGRWAEAASQTLQLALEVAHLAQSLCRAGMEVSGCWLRMRPAGLVSWLSTNTLSPLRSCPQSPGHSSWGQPLPQIYLGSLPPHLLANLQMEKTDMTYGHRTGEVNNLWVP